MKRPAFQFYPADWRKDAALQSCSIAARGLWIEVMCIAHECEPYGHLTINGKAMTPAQIGRLVGLPARECNALFAELEEAGVLSRSDDGTIFSRRMVRDEDLRQRRAAGGEAGSEHGIKGKEYGVKGGRPKKARGVSEPPIEPPPSSSSSPSGLNPLNPPSPAAAGRGTFFPENGGKKNGGKINLDTPEAIDRAFRSLLGVPPPAGKDLSECRKAFWQKYNQRQAAECAA